MSDVSSLASTILDTTAALIVVLAPEGRIVYFNRACERLSGYSRDEATNKLLWEFLLPQEHVEPVKQVFQDLMARKSPNCHESPWVIKGGDRRLIAWKNSVATDPEGGVAFVIGTGIDITDRRRLEEGLQESERLYRLLAENITDVIWTCNLDLRLTYVSPSATRKTGYTVEELMGLSVGDVLTPASYEAAMKVLGEEIALERAGHGDPERFRSLEVEVICKDGATSWIEARTKFLRDEKGQPVGIIGVARDVSDRKRAQDMLEEGERRLRSFFQQSKDAIYVITGDGVVVDFNRAALEMFGFTESETFGVRVRDMYADPEQWDVFRREIESKGFVKDREVRMRRKDGTEIICLNTASLWKDRDGYVLGYQGIIRDITEHKLLDEALARSEQLYRSLIESTGSVVVRVDREGKRTFVAGRILDAYKTRQGELLGGTFGDLIVDPLDRKRAQELLEETFRTGKPVHGFVASQRIGNEIRYVSSNWEPIRDAQGNVVEVQATSVDVTDLMKAQQELQALTRRLVEVQEEERRQVAREMHDQIGQLLTGLKLSLRRAARALGGDAIAELGESERQVDEILERVRDLSRQLRPSMLDDLGLLPALTWHIDRFKTQTGISVSLKHTGLDRPLPPAVALAAYRIVQEGLTNVARHSGAREATVEVGADGDVLNILVEDSGVGFDLEAVLARGPANGLAGMRERAAALRGRVQVRSAPGAGTKLSATLPLEAGLGGREVQHDDGSPGR